MDPHVRWLRRRILLALPRSIGAVMAVAGGLWFGGLLLLTDSAVIALVPWSLLAGQLVAAACVGWAVVTNPLSFRYLRAQGALRRSFRATSAEPDPELVEKMGHHRLLPLATIWDDTAQPVPAFDLFQTPKQTVTAARSRITGSVSLYTRLDDGRILLTESVATAPHSRLVLNPAPGPDTNSLVASHRNAIQELRRIGLDVRADDGRLFVEALAVEHDAYAELGPVLGIFLNLSRRPSPLRFLVAVRPAELRELAAGTPNSQPALVSPG